MSWRTDLGQAALDYPCSRCGADPGQVCRTRLGDRTEFPHQPRLHAVFTETGYHPPTRCRSCGLVVSGDVVDGECARCRRVRELWAERFAPSPRHRPEDEA